MSYGYGRPNPYDQRDSPAGGGGYGAPAGGGGYGAPAGGPPGGSYGQAPSPYGRNQYGDDQYGGGSNMEMSNLQPAGGGPNYVLNECSGINDKINEIDRNLKQLTQLQKRSLDESDPSTTNRNIELLSEETMKLARSTAERVRNLKSRPESRQPRNSQQVGNVDRRLKMAISSYQQAEAAFKNSMQAQLARQYRIAQPNLPEEEIQKAVQDPSPQPVFQNALMRANRHGQAESVLSAVRSRHQALQNIERQMQELSDLFTYMDTLVMQQDVAVVQIEQKGEEVVENLDKGNEEIATAVKTARSTRKKKWWCLGICVLIIIVIALVVVIYMAVTGKLNPNNNNNNNNTNNNKRAVIDMSQTLPNIAGAPSRILRSRIHSLDLVQDTITARFSRTGVSTLPVVKERV